MALNEADKESFDKIREKHEAKRIKAKEKLEEKKEAGELPKFLIEREPTGLLRVRFEKGGRLPDRLNMAFTSHVALKNAVVSQYGTDEPIR
jgi:hypothetical protein